MARYIENLNSCTDPTDGDYLWIVDASAASDDKDRKLDVGYFRLVSDNSFSALTATSLGAGGDLTLFSANLGTSTGRRAILGCNTNGTTPAPGAMTFVEADGELCYLWPDNSGILRTGNVAPISSVFWGGGTVVGTQTSSLDSKYLIAGMTSIDDVLAAVQRGAEAVRRFTYKNGAFNNEEFEGVVVDYAPRYGMDCDEEHEAGKSLNIVNAVGDLLRAVAWLVEREKARE